MEKPIEITYGMLGTKGQRFANNIIDSVVVYIIALIALVINTQAQGVSNLEKPETWEPLLSSFGFTMYNLAASIIYYGLLESVSARTLGKYITGTKVVMRDGSVPDSVTILLRTICRNIPFEFISFLFSPIGWHDSLSKTLVVNTKQYNAALSSKNSVNDIGSEDI